MNRPFPSADPPRPEDSAWSDFVVEHSAVIRRAIARYLHDPEDADDAYVRVLERLRREPPEEAIRSPKAWVAVVSTRVAIDLFRERQGRLRWPEAIESLDRLDRRVFELCHREGLDFRQTLDRLRQDGVSISVSELAACVHRVEAALTPAARRQIARLERGRVTGRSPRQIEVLEHVLEHALDASHAASPELLLIEKEAHALRGRLRRAVEGLEARDRELIHRYYELDESAVAIDRSMDFGGVRRVHTALERVRRQLKRALTDSETAPIVRPFAPGLKPLEVRDDSRN